MKTASFKILISLCLTFISIGAICQTSWHTDPYPLNKNIDIIHYSFGLKLEDITDEIKGTADITFRISAPEQKLYLDLVNNDTSGGMIVSSVKMEGIILPYQHQNNRLVIDCPDYHGGDTVMTVSIAYSGKPKDGLIISKNKFGDRSFFGDNWPDRARNWIPCVDHVSEKATVEFIVDAPEHFEVVANGYLFRKYQIEGMRTINHWKSDIALPPKVMVIGAAEFAVELAGYAGKTPVQTWVYPQNMNEGFFDYKPAVRVVEFFNDLIGEYAFEKLANVQSKTIYGGMENSGCIFYYENSVTGKGKVESLLAHEIAHQWFGDAVSEKDWHHVWLSEGFATYLTAVYMDAQYGNAYLENSMEGSRRRVISSYERNPVPVIDTSITDLMKLLSTNSYQKGAWVLHMLRQELGDDIFWTGIQSYYNKYKNENALSVDFKNSMEDVSHTSLDKFFEQWLSVAGQPELSLSWEWNSKKSAVEILCQQLQNQYIFEFPLELRLVDNKGMTVSDTVIRITDKSKSFNWTTNNQPDSLIIDPNIKLLYKLR